MADQEQQSQTSSDVEELVLQAEVGVKAEEKMRKQLTEFFDKISTDVRKCHLCAKLVRASQGKQSSSVEMKYWVSVGEIKFC